MLNQNGRREENRGQQHNGEVINSDAAVFSATLEPLEVVAGQGKCCTGIGSWGFNSSDRAVLNIDSGVFDFGSLYPVSKKAAKGSKATWFEVCVATRGHGSEGMDFFTIDLNKEAESGIYGLDLLPTDFVTNQWVDDLDAFAIDNHLGSNEHQKGCVANSSSNQDRSWVELDIEFSSQDSEGDNPGSDCKCNCGGGSVFDSLHHRILSRQLVSSPKGMGK